MDLTIGQISTFLAFLVGFISSIVYLSKIIRKVVKKTLEPINNSINNIDISQCKNFLVRFLADVEQGNELDEIEIERAYEIYDHYTNDLKQNSYIHKRWKSLENQIEKKEKK